MRRIVLILVLMFLSASASAATWAQFALGGGYDAVLMVSNKTPFPWSRTVTVYQGFNGAWAGRWYVNGIEYTRAAAYAVSLPPFGTAKLLFTGDSVLRVGYMDLDSDSSYSILDVAYSFFYNLRAGTDLLETIGGPAGCKQASRSARRICGDQHDHRLRNEAHQPRVFLQSGASDPHAA